jgi:acylphosphatase
MRIAFRIQGRVQGVGFRYFVLDHALLLDLAGWVRNAPDGSVEGAAEGEASALEGFHDHLARGPQAAHVTQLDWSPLLASQSLPHPFEIHR